MTKSMSCRVLSRTLALCAAVSLSQIGAVVRTVTSPAVDQPNRKRSRCEVPAPVTYLVSGGASSSRTLQSTRPVRSKLEAVPKNTARKLAERPLAKRLAMKTVCMDALVRLGLQLEGRTQTGRQAQRGLLAASVQSSRSGGDRRCCRELDEETSAFVNISNEP